jgi:CheY-like chemotaxis protein
MRRGGLRVVILQSSPKDAQQLAGFLVRRHDQAWQATRPGEALQLVQRHKPNILIVDLHLSGTDWLDLLRQVRSNHPTTRVIVTNKYPDLRREILAREQGVQVFLRQPFTRQWVERALARLAQEPHPGAALAPLRASPVAVRLPQVRFPVGLKITLPYVLLAIAFALGATYMVSRYVLETLQERFTGQLADVGTLAADWMVQEENRLLQTLRLLARTEDMAGAIAAGDAEAVRRLALPVVVNDRQEAVEVLMTDGTSVLSLRHVVGGPVEAYDVTRGEAVFRDWDFVASVLAGQVDVQGDKYAGLVRATWGDYFYVAGPVPADDGSVAGAILVGISLESLVRAVREDTLAQVTVYDLVGQPLASTIPASDALRPVGTSQAAE